MNNMDLISRSALLEAMPKNDELLSYEVRRVICNAPAVDAVPMDFHERCLGLEVRRRFNAEETARRCIENYEPVRHGRWEPCYEPVEVFVDAMCNTEIIDTQTGWICSECGRHGYGKTLEEMPYCHCGARMDGDVNGQKTSD